MVLLLLSGIGLGLRGHGAPKATAVTVPTVKPTKGHHHVPAHSMLASGVFATPFAKAVASSCPMTLSSPTKARIRKPHCTVLSIGDSLGIELGWGLATEFARSPWINLVQVGKVSTGLTNGWFYNWPKHLNAFLAMYHPNVVVAFMGANDEQNFFVNNQLAVFGSAAWHKIYGQQVRLLAAEAARYHATFVWGGLPVMQATPYGHGIHALNNTVATALRHVPGTAYINTEPVLAGPAGQFLPTAYVNGVAEQLRSGDGIHMDYAGEQVVSTFVTQQMDLLLHVHVVPAAPAAITKY